MEPFGWYVPNTNLFYREKPKGMMSKPLYTTPQTKPLSDEEIIKLFWDASWGTDEDVVKFARAIEERHGIK